MKNYRYFLKYQTIYVNKLNVTELIFSNKKNSVRFQIKKNQNNCIVNREFTGELSTFRQILILTLWINLKAA